MFSSVCLGEYYVGWASPIYSPERQSVLTPYLVQYVSVFHQLSLEEITDRIRQVKISYSKALYLSFFTRTILDICASVKSFLMSLSFTHHALPPN
jgi:hypothetical protein